MTSSREIVLPLSPGYVPTWHEFEVVREIIQNAIDEDEQRGNKMTIEHDGERLFVKNDGANLRAEAMLIGESGKADRRLRGEHGEGLDLAMLVASRLGLNMEITTPESVWSPRIRFSDDLNAHCLVVRMRPNVPRGNYVAVSLDLSAESWAKIRKRFTFIDEPADAVRTGHGTLILDDDRIGDVYVKGIWVTRRPDFPFGIDLPNVSLDRDRRMIQDFDLKWECGRVMAEALERQPQRFAARAYEMIEKKIPGAEYITPHVYRNSLGAAALVEQFRAKHGPDAVPCRDLNDSMRLDGIGYQGVLVEDSLATLIEHETGTSAQVVEQHRFDVSRSYAWNELTETEQDNITEASAAIRRATDHPAASFAIEIVDFKASDLLGSCELESGAVRVARSQASDFYDLLTTLIHEIAHAQTSAGDGTAAHTQQERALWCAVYRAEREADSAD